MALHPTLLSLFRSLMASWDPSIDTSDGSDFYNAVLLPLLTRAGGDPLDVDVEAFTTAFLGSVYPDLDLSLASTLRTVLIQTLVPLLEPYRREASSIRISQSLQNYALLTREEMNALLANFFTQLRDGNTASGTVRVWFSQPRAVTVTPYTSFTTASGLVFRPTTVQSISSSQMSFNQDADLFFADFQVEADAVGAQYNIEPGAIQSSSLTGYTKISNLGRMATPGTDDETNEEGYARAQLSITQRTLTTSRGVAFVLGENFPDLDTLQVIGRGDPEMTRDLVVGPITISGIPGGVQGLQDPSLGIGQSVHVGGMTDVWIWQPVPDPEDLDILNLTDQGRRLFAGKHGYTEAGSPTTSFKDLYGLFTQRGLVVGDLLRLGEDLYEISGISSTTLTVGAFDGGPSTIAAGLFDQHYEIVRRSPGFLTIPLYDLVALEEGSPMLDVNGDPVSPIPGSLTNAPLLSSGSPVAKTENIATENLQLPLIRISRIELLDPLTQEPLDIFLPLASPFQATDPTGMSGGGVGTYATGTIRIFFKDAVNAWVSRSLTRFTANGVYAFRPVAETQGSGLSSSAAGTVNTSTLTLSGTNAVSVFSPGTRVEILSGSAAGVYCVLSAAFSSPNTLLTIRETLPATFSGVDWLSHQGLLQADMDADAETGLYFWDVPVEAMATGAAYNLPAGTSYGRTNVRSEGWFLGTTDVATTYSTRELPYLLFTDWANDDLWVADPGAVVSVRVSYEYAARLAEVQTFCDSPSQRTVAEDLLVRHFLPVYVRTRMSLDLDEETARDALTEAIDALDPGQPLEASDLVAPLESAGATHVVLPFTLVGLAQNALRQWSLETSQDALATTRVQHFIAEPAATVITEI